ncbi:uncharacterized protein LOC125234773 [Leguminivora glycinivorella]|uniref:uncharacterized protein LOC125234773 n=1 Tax=Leguminivora glycinivorella TaxID=1035111 RepID=UPI00200D3A21|nr:uncharacterized protein LOC125234773 [Leguminivora glycinivorella]XP_047997125.1 uncharacterized protein LOC125234773 [Leguminivora glycinivorella]XP_047997126.1 uncharacterized protein LOC125234773 [Leguminivora glycinivorella]
MELVALVKEGFQNVAEHAASYKFGQTVLRHVDKALWVLEKCARWAVPPPLEPEERPQPELVRPLPWVFFLMMLVALRITRESISLINLVLGKPPLRSADVVTYIQGKRRYLRTLKYQGNRMMRARTGSTTEPWYSGLRSLFEFTMCFRRQSVHYGNNNTTRVSNNDEVLVVKRTKRPRQEESPASTSEATMERLIEKMMVDLDADSDEDSSYTLTNATSLKSDRSDMAESDQEPIPSEEPVQPTKSEIEAPAKHPSPKTFQKTRPTNQRRITNPKTINPTNHKPRRPPKNSNRPKIAKTNY